MDLAKSAATLNQLKKKLDNNFIRNLGWLGSAQIVIRISRLATTVVLARFLSSYDYGLAAIVLTTYEFVNVFTSVGIGAKIIQADAEELEEICSSAYWLNWAIFSGLFVLQCLASFPIAWFYGDDRLILPICALSLVYLMGPIGSIHASLLNRENKLKVIAFGKATQLSAANLLAALLAFLGFGMWAIVLPKVLAYPIGIYINYTHHPWRVSQGFTTKRWGEIFNFGKSLLGVNLLNTFRNNFDYLLVGRFIGVKELGLYFFAFNAGLGISLTIINSITTALYPHLCALRSNWPNFKKHYFSSLKVIALIIVPFVFLQSSLAPFYVPIVFGSKWIPAIPILILICLSAIPRPFSDAASSLLVAVGQPHLSLRLNLLFSMAFVIALLIGVQWQAIGVATAVFLVHLVIMPLMTAWATRHVFSRQPVS